MLGLDTTGRRTRRIGRWGTISRVLVGAGFLAGAVLDGIGWPDVVFGLVGANAIVIGVLWLRGTDAPPLRATGPLGHCVNCALIVAFFVVLPVGALLFYGTSMLLAAATGSGGCEMSAISNLLRRRDDEVGCPFFAPFDVVDARHSQLEEA
jgi:hypothetical protein